MEILARIPFSFIHGSRILFKSVYTNELDLRGTKFLMQETLKSYRFKAPTWDP